MAGQRVRWDDENTRHLLVERAERWISKREVEAVLMAQDTVRAPARSGRVRAVGRTAAGRCLIVIYAGFLEMRPVTAWETTGREWERWRT
jgi:uncharacterized DUF497 family protein